MPKNARQNRWRFALGVKVTFGRSRYKITAAKISATKLRKKLFCMEGRSPESRTNRFIKAKKKDDAVMHKIPFCFCVIIKLLSEKIARGLLYDGFWGKKRENTAFSKKRTARYLSEGYLLSDLVLFAVDGFSAGFGFRFGEGAAAVILTVEMVLF